jgi:hypothetical protein
MPFFVPAPAGSDNLQQVIDTFVGTSRAQAGSATGPGGEGCE